MATIREITPSSESRMSFLLHTAVSIMIGACHTCML